jgi:hypothetical protein
MLQFSVLLTALMLVPVASPKSPALLPESPAVLHDYCDTENHAWQGGEEITYTIYYKWGAINMAAGEAKFRVKDLGDRYFISIVGKTINAFEWFYKVDDRYETVIDKKTLLPLSFSRDINEGEYIWWDKFMFDQKNHKVKATKGWPDKPTEYYTADLSGCMHDMISIVYNVRNVDFDKFKAGEEFGIKVFVEEEYPLKVEVRSKNQKTKIQGLGNQLVHLIRPQVVSGHFFNEDTRMDIYMSADQNRIPLMIESPVSVGTIRAVLTDYKGLKYSCNFKQ